MAISNDGITRCLTKMVYPSVAAINNATICSIERNIRTAIKRMWQNSKQENLYDFFGEIKFRKYPTNLQVIYTLTEKAINYCMSKIKYYQNIA